MAGFENSVLICDNVNFNTGLPKPHFGLITTDGQLIIGSTALNAGGTHLNIGTLSSSNSTITITNGPGTISLTAGSQLANRYTADSGVAAPAANNLNVFGSGSFTTTGAASNLTLSLTGLTNHAVLVGAGTSTITKVGPTGTAGQVLQSGGAAADPAFSTATFPATATGTGTILRADGTNWVATTATYPATTTSQQILYSTAANVIGQLTTANSALAATNSSGTLAMRAFSTVIQVFTGNGTYTPTSGMLYCIIEAVGGGGGGGGGAATGVGTFANAGGGGYGEYASGAFSATTIGASQTVTIGAAGAAGAAGNNAGGNGGATSVGALISSNGGTGGNGGAASAASQVAGGAGGTGGSGGTIRFPGTPGGWGLGAVAAGILMAGIGASGRFGAGGASTQGVANAGAGFGAGGGGAANLTSLAARAGAAGTAGYVVVTEFVIA